MRNPRPSGRPTQKGNVLSRSAHITCELLGWLMIQSRCANTPTPYVLRGALRKTFKFTLWIQRQNNYTCSGDLDHGVFVGALSYSEVRVTLIQEKPETFGGPDPLISRTYVWKKIMVNTLINIIFRGWCWVYIHSNKKIRFFLRDYFVQTSNPSRRIFTTFLLDLQNNVLQCAYIIYTGMCNPIS